MANRPVFVPRHDGETLVDIINIEFDWHPGLAVSQKQKSVASLHNHYREQTGACAILEVSSKSTEELGSQLSAFNMGLQSKRGHFFSVEALFQSSKVFEDNGKVNGPFREIMYLSSAEAKRYDKLKSSGNIACFSYQPNTARPAVIWQLEPKTAFYDWLYINALHISPWKERVMEYEAFTDIEFNPKKSVNCQAYSVALYQALRVRGYLRGAVPAQDEFLTILKRFVLKNSSDKSDMNFSLL
ncbi:hypothetical protein MT962_002710 [Franconibacter sp. IITDAS19]|uniref:DarT1-associated NADAR antitoxin family protein n=1 Tax=Franconibacter sp. IITDAS19 TaxID=2930569 RepID=UPI001FF70762|nr:hypothetical protein [Franconibacter sp. IITDAS19]MCK1968871.1 hypothetical protein [Franconibacter sp. IITDAS19]